MRIHGLGMASGQVIKHQNILAFPDQPSDKVRTDVAGSAAN